MTTPAKPKRELRDQRLTIVFTASERKQLERACGHERLTNWIRRQAMTALAAERRERAAARKGAK